MSTNIIDLSWRRKKEIIWLGRHDIDMQLISQCAYYPRPPAFESNVSPCNKCSVDNPLKSCKYSHILTFEEPESKPKSTASNVDRLIKGLSSEDREAIVKFLASRRS
jgi:hypothetical protein